MRRPSLWVLFIFCLSQSGWAQSLNLQSEETQRISYLSFSSEFTQLKVEEESIQGSGAKLGYHRQIWRMLDSEIFVSSTINMDGGLKPGSTTIGFYGYYNFFSNDAGQRSLIVNNQKLVTESYSPTQQLKLGAGIEQVFLSGDRGVYSIAGPGFQLVYEHTLGSWHLIGGIRSASLQTSDIKVTSTTFNLGVVLPL